MRRLLLVILALFFSLPAYSQAKHPFTFEDMMKLKRVGEPVPSPDGNWVLFSAVDVDLEKNTRTPHIWIVPLTASESNEGVPHPSPKGRMGEEGLPNSSPQNTGVAPSSPGLGRVGERERMLISDQDGDRPRWAPDGKRFAFISTKEEGSQVWIADFDGSAGTVTGTHKLTAIATEAGGELWSPDGKNILFVSDVYPECDGPPAEEQECNAKKLKEREESKVKALIFEHLLYRHWNAYREGKRSHIFVVAVPTLPSGEGSGTPGVGGAGALARDLTPGDYDSPVFSLGGQDNYAFSPDGQEICYTSNHDPVPAISTNNDLWIIPVDVGAGDSPVQIKVHTKNITADNPASDSTPLYSPDGKYIAYRAQQRPGYESDRFRLMLYDRSTGERKNPTENFDGWVGTFTWTPDSKELFFTSEDHGNSPIYLLAVAEGAPTTLISGDFDDLIITRDRTKMFFTSMSLENPNEIQTLQLPRPGQAWIEPLLGKKGPIAHPEQIERLLGKDRPLTTREQKYVRLEPMTLTRINESVLSQVAMSPLEPFWFTGALGDKVQGFLVRPPNFDPSKKYPVKFLIHGGPQGAWGDDWSYRWNPELFAANGYVVVMINFHGSTGYGQKFIDAINGDWGGAPFEDLMKGLDYAEQHYPFIDKDRECALGASYGGYMVNWILGHTNRFKCLVSHDGMFNTTSAWGTTEELWFNEWEFKGTPYTNREMYRKWSPHLSATSFKTPTLVIHGQRDYRLDVSEGFQLFTTLQRLGVPSKMLYFPDEGHWVLKPQNSQLWYKTVNDWVDQWLKK